MTRPARFTKDDVRRAVTGVTAAGQPVASVRIHPNGYIELLIGRAKPAHDNDEWADLE